MAPGEKQQYPVSVKLWTAGLMSNAALQWQIMAKHSRSFMSCEQHYLALKALLLLLWQETVRALPFHLAGLKPLGSEAAENFIRSMYTKCSLLAF